MPTVKEDLVSNLKDILSFGKVFPIDDFPKLRKKLTESNIIMLKKTWKSVYNSVSFMVDRVESFNFDVNSEANDETEYFISTYKKFKNVLLKARPVSNDMFSLRMGVLAFRSSSLGKLFLWNEGNQILATIQIFTVYLVFEYKDIEDEERKSVAKTALNEFCETGEIIRTTNYEETMTCFIEKILLGDFDALNNCLKMKGNDILTEDSLDGTFVALAAPSLEGKTQTAFTLKNVLPLYFSLKAEHDVKRAQAIYMNYASLNESLEKFAKRDLKTFVGEVSDDENFDYKKISGSELKKCGQKSFVLGFLCALIEDANENYLKKPEETRGPWMKYHAERKGKNFSFEAKTISAFKKNFKRFKGFCLFLDEFIGEPWAIFIRNLARVIGLRCIVANTNGKIANLTGKSSVNFSGVSKMSRQSIWSIVITSLGLISWEALKIKYPNLEEKLNVMIEAVGNQYTEDKNLLREFLQNQPLNYLRPGLADFLANSIVNDEFDVDKSSFTLAKFLAKATRILSKNMTERKSYCIETNYGLAASVGLLFSEAYEDSIIDSNSEDNNFSSNFHNRSFIENHYYYLINPTNPKNPKNPKNPIFITFPNSNKNDESSLVLNESESEKWLSEATYFKETEFMTILSSFNLLIKKFSFYNIFFTALIKSNNKKNSPIDAKNSLAIKSDGNRLETFVAAAIIDASHHPADSHFNTFEGQKGDTLVSNFIENLIFENWDTRKLEENEDSCDIIKSEYKNGFNLKGYLENLIIPFLYSENSKLPDALKQLSVQNADQLHKTRSVLIDEYKRPADGKQIDGLFKCYQRPYETPSGTSSKRPKTETLPKSCVLECKNRKNNILYGDLETIISKALGKEDKKDKKATEGKDAVVTDAVVKDEVVKNAVVKDKVVKNKSAKNALVKDKAAEDKLVKDAVLSFVICQKLGNSGVDAIESFEKFCTDNKVNVFRLDKQNSEPYEIVEMQENLLINPEHVCIVIELKTLKTESGDDSINVLLI